MPADIPFPNQHAARRACEVPPDLAAFPALSDNWNRSRERIDQIRSCLNGAGLPRAVRTLAVAGSLGRMEYGESSDCDLLVVLTDAAKQNPAIANDAYACVWYALEPLNLEPPKATGTFASPTSEQHLCDKRNVGAPDEDLRVLAKRLLLLLETQPVYDDQYDALVAGVVQSYAEGYVDKDPRKEWVFLLNDLMRYFRSLCVNYQWDFRIEPTKWPLRNTKLRHSRLAMYGGLLMLLGQCSLEKSDKITWLRSRLKMTPLERIAWTYATNEDGRIGELLGYYEYFLAQISRSEVRDALKAATPDSYEKRYENPHYKALKENSDKFVAELLRFTLSRHGTWSPRFFEYLIY
jgi:hypothetical protein